MKIYRIISILLFIVLLSSCKKDDTVLVSSIGQNNSYGKIETSVSKDDNVSFENMTFDFKTTTVNFLKMDYFSQSENGFYTYKIPVKGNEIFISYVDDSNEENAEFITIKDYENLPKKTIYIETDLSYMVCSVPSVYKKERVFDSISAVEEVEIPITITKDVDTYYITYAFPKSDLYYSELFYIKSDLPLIELNETIRDMLVRNELSGRFRLLKDGFYQVSYDTYFPTGKGSYFRNCANYPAYNFIKYNTYNSEDIPLFDYLSYAITYVSNMNISEYGFFETKSRSNWLYDDFLIDKDFYDTRFNADNGILNILLYNRFLDDSFMDTLETYADFFMTYAYSHSYKTDRGILVEDYYNPKGGIKTHVSLNHHLANLNFLLLLYNVTNDENYLNVAKDMLYGVEDSYKEWIMDDYNLEYALFYTGTNNTMKDYPYLTYNDLVETKYLLNGLGIYSDEIDTLIESKKIYMTNNGITGYRQ